MSMSCCIAVLSAEQDVVGDAERRDHSPLLVDGGDAQFLGVGHPGEADRLAPEPQLPAVGAVHPGDSLDEGALASPVLTDQRVDLAGPQLQAHLVERLDVGEGLADVAHLQDRRAGRGLVRRRGPVAIAAGRLAVAVGEQRAGHQWRSVFAAGPLRGTSSSSAHGHRGLQAAGEQVHQDREQDDQALGKALVIDRHAEQELPLGQHGHESGAEQRAESGAAATEQARPADHHGADSVELHADARLRCAGAHP
jgi:hypothetical protein